jgi:hypothetical protein
MRCCLQPRQGPDGIAKFISLGSARPVQGRTASKKKPVKLTGVLAPEGLRRRPIHVREAF